MRSRVARACLVVLATVAMLFAYSSRHPERVAAQGASQAPAASSRAFGPFQGYATPPLGSFPKASPPGAPVDAIPEGARARKPNVPPAPGTTGQPDPVLQTESFIGEAPAALNAPVVSVAGQTSGFTPPDPVGDVGPRDYVQMINSNIAVYDKKGALRAGFPKSISALFSTLPAGSACSTRNDGDPIVLYDQQVDRWMISQFTDPRTPRGPNSTYPMCIAYSQTGDPTGTWWAYQFNLPRSEDYQKYGIWPDGLYMSTYEGSTLGTYVFERAAMLGGSPATFIDFGSISAGSGVNGRENRILPADWDGVAAPPAGGIPFVISFDNGFDGGNDRLELYAATVDWSVGTGSFTLTQTLNTAAFDTDLSCTVASDNVNRACIPQPGTTTKVDALSNRLMHRLQYRNFGDHESMVVSQTVDADGNDRAGIRWYELRRSGSSWSIFQEGTYAPVDGVHRWMPSAAMDGKGNIAVGYSVSDGTSTFPGLRYTGRRIWDPLDALPAGEQTLIAGTTSQTAGSRWGDYSALTVDPLDDCTFWYTGQINGNSGTQIGAFRFSDCGTDLAISKTVTPQHPNAGEEIVYTITVDNFGDVSAANVVVTDVLPTQVKYLANTDTCSGVSVGATGTLTCQLGTIAAWSSKSFDIKVRINADLNGPTSITNTASVTSDTADSNPLNDTVSLTHLVNELADLAVTKFCKPDTTTPAGTTGTCQIFVHNYGPSAARLVSVTDTHVSNGSFTIGNVTSTSGGCVNNASTVTCTVSKLQPDATLQINVDITSPNGVDVNDTAVAASSTPDPDSSNDEATAGLSFTASADLSVVKGGPASATAGTEFTYTLNVANAGPSGATGVIVVDTLPAGVTFKSATASTGTFTATNGVVTWTIGSVAAGATPSLQITVAVNPQTTGQLVNNASISATTSDPNTSNNSTSFTTLVNAVSALTISKVDSPDPVIAGANLTYTIAVGNGGPSTAVNVVVTDALPSGTSLVSAVGGTGSTVCAAVLPNGVSCDVGALNPGQTSTIFITVKVASNVPTGTVLVNTAIVTSPTSPQASATSTTTVLASADLWMEKTGTASAGNPAGALTYRLIVHNHPGSAADSTPTSGLGGPSDAQNVRVVDTLPLDPKKLIVQFMSPNCSYDMNTHKVTCTAATVPFGASVAFEIQVQVKGSSGTITNAATVSSDTPDPASANNTDTVNNVVQGSTGKGTKPR